MRLTRTLEESIRDMYVVVKNGNFSVSNQHWGWCMTNHRPFVRIVLGTPRSQYANVSMDAYPVMGSLYSRMSPETRLDLLKVVAGCRLKPGRRVQVGQITVDAYVGVENAIALAIYLGYAAELKGAIVNGLNTTDIVYCTKKELPGIIQVFEDTLRGGSG